MTWQYEYVARDHLGNTRVCFADRNGNGRIEPPGELPAQPDYTEIIQENHYYPFGMELSGPWAPAQTQPDKPYRYNGKELNADLGLNWYDYGARWYDPAVGRFTGVDPLAEEFAGLSAYNYASNNPAGNIDLYGLQGLPINEQMDFFENVRANGFIEAVKSYFDFNSLVFPSDGNRAIKTLSTLHSIDREITEIKDKALDAVDYGADVVIEFTEAVEYSAYGATALSGGLLSEATGPALFLAELGGLTAQGAKVLVDYARDGRLEDETIENVVIEVSSFGAERIVSRGVKALKLETPNNPHHAEQTSKAIEATGLGTIKVSADAVKKEKEK